MSAPAPHIALSRPYMTVDVFTHTALLGNPVAVVLGADGLSDAQMQAFARWTNLSETTFVLQPSTAALKCYSNRPPARSNHLAVVPLPMHTHIHASSPKAAIRIPHGAHLVVVPLPVLFVQVPDQVFDHS